VSTYAQQAALAGDPGFQARVKASMVTNANVILAVADADDARPRVFDMRCDLATAVISTDPVPFVPQFALACATTSAVRDEIAPSLTAIASTAPGPPAVITTAVAHGLADGATVAIAGAADPQVNGTWTIHVTGTTTFTIPVTGSLAGPAGGTVTAQPDDNAINSAVTTVWNMVAGVRPGMV
jgi:hypothetical protein